MDHFWANSQNTVFSRRQLFKKLEERNSSINNAKQRLVHCCTRLSVAMSWERANDRYKDHLDGQLTKQTGETNICGCGTSLYFSTRKSRRSPGGTLWRGGSRRATERLRPRRRRRTTTQDRTPAGRSRLRFDFQTKKRFSLKLCFF